LHTQLLMDPFNSLMDRSDSSEEIDSSVTAFSIPDLNSMLMVLDLTLLTLTSSTSMDQSMVILRELQMTMAPSDLQSVLMLLSSVVVMDFSEMLLVSPEQDKQDLMHSSLLVLSMVASLVASLVDSPVTSVVDSPVTSVASVASPVASVASPVASVASVASLVPMDLLALVLT